MSFVDKFRGGMMKPLNTDGATFSFNQFFNNQNPDVVKSYRILDDNTTYKSKLQPIFLGNDNSSFILDEMQLKIFWDQTTVTLPGAPGFIESPSDDYHPMPEIEFAEGASALSGADRFVRTPHFVVKPDSTSQFYGKDRFDNYMVEPLSSFGGKFTWFDNRLSATSTTKTTFNGGDIYGNERGLHMAFLYLKNCMDFTVYQADLYYSRYSDIDGTFQNPMLLETNIDVFGAGTPLETFKNFNRKTNPKFVEIPSVGLFINTLRSSYNSSADTTEYYLDMKISKDDGTNWSNYNRVPLNLFWSARKGTSQNINMINDMYCPYMHWVYAEDKMVGMFEFRDYRSNLILEEKEHINIIVSEDQGKTFKQVNIDFSKILASISTFANTDYNRYVLGSMHYDKKNSKFVITMGITTTVIFPITTTAYGLIVLTNLDDKLEKWDVSLTENLNNWQYFQNKYTKRYVLGWNVSNFGAGSEQYLHGHGPKFLSMTDEDNNSWIVMNCGMSYKGAPNSGLYGRNFDEFADYSGWISNADTQFAWTPTSLLLGLELMPATDSFLNQYIFGTAPHRARKFTGSFTHRNRKDNDGAYTNVETNDNGIPPGQGASVSIYLDSIIENLDGRIAATAVNQAASTGNTSPLNTFYIQSFTRYKNNFWFLGTDTVLTSAQENRYMEYQIPTLIYRPEWSNVNIKPRKNVYFNPTKYQDGTFVGWGRNATLEAGENIRNIYPPETKKYWETQFFRNQATPDTGIRCALQHLSDTSAFINIKGTAWDIDATRGAFAHFVCSVDSLFHGDTTSMVHYLAVPTTTTPFNGYASGNKSILQTFIGKDHIGFRSSGSATTNFYATNTGNSIDTTRNMEFLVIVNRFRNLDTTHEHRAFFRYFNDRDWTLMYFSLCAVGTGFISTSPGFMFGNLMRWPTGPLVNSKDITSMVYFKFHAEGWSGFEMHRFYPANVSGVLTPSPNNLLSVLPQPCMHPKTFIPRGLQIGWAGQDATCGANFKITNYQQKNGLDKMFDDRPNVKFVTAGAVPNQPAFSITIDLGYTISFDSVAIYNHNLRSSRFFFGQENNTTDLTAFLLLDQNMLNVDGTDFINMMQFRQEKISKLDKNVILSYDQDFVKYVKFNKDKLNGKNFQFTGTTVPNEYFYRKLKYFEIWNDSSVYLEFETAVPAEFAYPNDMNLLNLNVVAGYNFFIENNKHFFQLSKKINARYIKITESDLVGTYQNVPDGSYFIGMVSFGNYQENENPIENGFIFKDLSPSSIVQKYAGSGNSTLLTNNRRREFNYQLHSAYNRSGGQFEQIDNFFNSIGGNKSNFYFFTNMAQGDGTFYSSTETTFGFKKYTLDFYLVRNKGGVPIQKKGNNSNININLEEVT